jgi:hypothetical protein
MDQKKVGKRVAKDERKTEQASRLAVLLVLMAAKTARLCDYIS